MDIKKDFIIVVDETFISTSIKNELSKRVSHSNIYIYRSLSEAKALDYDGASYHFIIDMGISGATPFDIIYWIRTVRDVLPSTTVSLMTKNSDWPLLEAICHELDIDHLIDKSKEENIIDVIFSPKQILTVTERELERAAALLDCSRTKADTLTKLAQYTPQNSIAIDEDKTNAAISKRIGKVVQQVGIQYSALLLWFRK
ncbi:hypothetical protein [Vibrio chaetopteri]|uniref:Response regulator n=1 Tax=Vibrio chaetopteri TaxID=3016528 RepID=A0AAU8BTJ6_9VIBR